jgi:crotonobetainyl-CoA:carnitine CoA-transferase CaiB-like acyl-CoA transferase
VDERYRTSRARVLNRKTLLPALQSVLATRPRAHWLEKIRAAGVPAGSVRTVPQALDAPEVEARGLIADTPDARHGRVRLMRSPLALRGTPPREPVAPPRLGEHTDQVLGAVLGAAPGDLAAWREAGVIA